MFNQTNMIIGSLYAISAAVGGICVLGVAKITDRINDRAAKKDCRKAIASAMEYLQNVYYDRVHATLDLLESSDTSEEIKEEIRDLLDCPL